MGKTNNKSNTTHIRSKTKSINSQKWTNNKGRAKSISSFTSEEKQKHAIKMKMQNKIAQKAQEAAKQREEREKIKQEKQLRIQAYKKKRMEKAKILSKKTKRGQPLMKDRMQLLLKQIQELKKSS